MLHYVFLWLILGMVTCASAFQMMSDEIDMAVGQEPEEFQSSLRTLIIVIGVLVWPLLLAEMLQRRP